MTFRRFILAAAACAVWLAAASPTVGQTPANDDPEATLLDDVIVVGRVPGPAWWKVTKGDAVVWIMGLPPTPTPRGMIWDQAPLERRLAGARVLLVPRWFGQGTTYRDKDPRPVAPGDLLARFHAVRTSMGEPAEKYARSPTLSHAVNDLYWEAKRRLQTGSVYDEITALAKTHRVKVRTPEVIKMKSVFNMDLPTDSPEIRACITRMLDDIEQPIPFADHALAWSGGRIAEALSAPRNPVDTCEIPGLWPRASRLMIDQQTAGIEAALTEGGKTVALVPLRQLLAQQGVIASLRARGFEVSGPSEHFSEPTIDTDVTSPLAPPE